MWKPTYTITDGITEALLEIGRAQGSVESHSWSPIIEEQIRFKARVRSTHYSTSIEGNRLTLDEAEDVVSGRRVDFAGRKRDVGEVDRYWRCEGSSPSRSITPETCRNIIASWRPTPSTITTMAVRRPISRRGWNTSPGALPTRSQSPRGRRSSWQSGLPSSSLRRCAPWIPGAVESSLSSRNRAEISSRQVADLFSISQRAARDAITGWVENGLLEVRDRSNRRRTYGLSAVYRKYVGGLSEVQPSAEPGRRPGGR